MFMVCQNFSLINNCFVIFVPRSWYHDENSQSHYDPIHFYTRKKNPLNGMITTADLANWPQPSDTGPESLIHAETWLKVVYKRGSSVSRIRNKTITLYACIDLRNCASLTRCLAWRIGQSYVENSHCFSCIHPFCTALHSKIAKESACIPMIGARRVDADSEPRLISENWEHGFNLGHVY